jgi:nucleotide-binding universal stress UspA family protein
LIVMGGYGRGPVLEVVLGSALDQVLRQSHRPTLICR